MFPYRLSWPVAIATCVNVDVKRDAEMAAFMRGKGKRERGGGELHLVSNTRTIGTDCTMLIDTQQMHLIATHLPVEDSATMVVPSSSSDRFKKRGNFRFPN